MLSANGILKGRDLYRVIVMTRDLYIYLHDPINPKDRLVYLSQEKPEVLTIFYNPSYPDEAG